MDWIKKWWGWLVIWGACLVVVIIGVIACNAAGLRPFSGVDKDRMSFYLKEQCEPIDTQSFLLQKEDFWSNYSYLAGGLMILCMHDRWMGRFYGIVLIYLAFCSAWYHGTLTTSGQLMDIAGVYAALLGTAMYALYELTQMWPDDPIAWFLLLLSLPAGLIGATIRGDIIVFDSTWFAVGMGVVIFALMIVGFRIAPKADPSGEFPSDTNEQRSKRLWPPLLFALVLCIIGCAGKFTDGMNFLGPKLTGGKCLYDSGALRWFQGHAIWHLATGLMFPCIFEFFRSINNRGRSVWPWRWT